ncbi:MAG: DUF3047 domain-containing protein [Pseudomonadota bacterium]|nr:DUF3047 domain-containing protein [Pseudomonadota bacterium]
MKRLWLAGLTFLVLAAAAGSVVEVGRFSAGRLEGWKTESFAGQTRYRLVTDGTRQVLRADSDGAASAFYREIKVDLARTPYLSWSWRIDSVIEGIDERSQAGDDFPARVYVVVSGGLRFWKTRALIYVWANAAPPGSAWNNPFTANARVLVLRSGNRLAGRWVEEKRNVRDDFRRLFGGDIDHIDGVAVMTDADNSGRRATAWYGDIAFADR